MIADRYGNNGKPTLRLNPVQQQVKYSIENKIEAEHYSFEKVVCPICDNNNFHLLAEKDRYGLYCPNVACKRCGLVMINPRMTTRAYQEFYNLEYRDLYTGRQGNAANFFKGQLVRGARLFQYLTSNNLLLSPEKNPLVLEIGCGAGGILSYFKDRGYQVKGLDLGAEYLKYGVEQHGLDLSVGTIHDVELSTPPNLVIYSHVMEHITDPVAELTSLRKITDNQTLIYVEVPGVKNLSTGYRKDPLRYFQNAHTFSFSLTSLNNLFIKNGFTKLQGDEFVKAVFKRQFEEHIEIENDYQSVVDYLKTSENDRKYYAISRARFQVIRNAIFNHISSIVKK